MRRPPPRTSGMRRLRWVVGAFAFLLIYLFLFRSSSTSTLSSSSSTPATVTPDYEMQIRSEPSLASECSDWEYVSLSPSRDVKLLSALFYDRYNLSFVLVGPRADKASMWAPKNVRSICTVRPKAHGMQTYTVFCPFNTTEDRYRADARGEVLVNLQVDDVMFRKVAVCKDTNVKSRPRPVALCSFVSSGDLPWLQQWLEYHTMMGIDTFYLYEAVETSRTPSRVFGNVAALYGEIVQWRHFTYHPTVMKSNPERARVAAYNDCWMRHRNSTSWLGFLELQDFIYSPRGIENITETLLALDKKNFVELTAYPMQDTSAAVAKREGNLMIEKYQLRREYPSGKRSFAEPSAITFVGDSKLVETGGKINAAKTDLEILTYAAERDGFNTQDPHRWKAFPDVAQKFARELKERLERRYH